MFLNWKRFHGAQLRLLAYTLYLHKRAHTEGTTSMELGAMFQSACSETWVQPSLKYPGEQTIRKQIRGTGKKSPFPTLETKVWPLKCFVFQSNTKVWGAGLERKVETKVSKPEKLWSKFASKKPAAARDCPAFSLRSGSMLFRKVNKRVMDGIHTLSQCHDR